jgi:hypothetical protein
MFEDKNKKSGAFRRLGQKIAGELIQVVPEELAICEFDCRKASCTVEQWRRCERRIEKARGELRPAA